MKPYSSPSATRYTVGGTARMDSGRLVIRNPLTASSRPEGRSAYRKAAEITEQTRGTGSDGAGEGASHAAAADTDATDEVEPAGHFRIYLGAAPGVGKTYAMLSEGQRRRERGADVVAGFVEAYGRPAHRSADQRPGGHPAQGGRLPGTRGWRRWTSTRSCADNPRSR